MSLLFRLRIHHHALEGPVVHISSYLSYPESRPGHVPWNMCYKYLVFLKSDHHSSYLITSIWSENYHSSGVYQEFPTHPSPCQPIVHPTKIEATTYYHGSQRGFPSAFWRDQDDQVPIISSPHLPKAIRDQKEPPPNKDTKPESATPVRLDPFLARLPGRRGRSSPPRASAL